MLETTHYNHNIMIQKEEKSTRKENRLKVVFYLPILLGRISSFSIVMGASSFKKKHAQYTQTANSTYNIQKTMSRV